MQIHQFKLQYSAEEDRVVFYLNTITGEDFRFYLTRRFVHLLWPVLKNLLAQDYKRREPETSHVADAMLEFEQEKVVSKANFSQEYTEEAKAQPLGKDIILLTRIQVKKGQAGDILCLLPTQGKGLEFNVNPQFLHMFSKMLKEITAKADWGLGFVHMPHNTAMAAPVSKTIH